jgi:hypothetical protein
MPGMKESQKTNNLRLLGQIQPRAANSRGIHLAKNLHNPSGMVKKANSQARSHLRFVFFSSGRLQFFQNL